MTSISLNTNSWASLFNEKAKAIINNVSKVNQELATDKFAVPEKGTPGKSSSVQSNTQPKLVRVCERELTESELAYIKRYACPQPLIGILHTGEMSKRTEKFGEELAEIVMQYFETLKEEFGCTTRDYMPYQAGVPEYDPEITKQMTDALHEMVLSDLRCESLIRSKGGIWPPPRPEEYDPMTMNYGPGWGGRLRDGTLALRV